MEHFASELFAGGGFAEKKNMKAFLLSLSLSLSLSRFARGLAPRLRAAFKLPANQSGFSLLGSLAAAAIGLVVVMGTTQSFVQQKVNLLALEKRIARTEVNRRGADGLQMFMGKAWHCKNTLKEKKLSAADSGGKRAIEIAAIKDSAAPPADIWDFSKSAAGELTSAAAKERLKSLGIDKFIKLEFVYKAANPKWGQIVLSSKTEMSGLLERNNKPIVWELSGVSVAAKTAAEAIAEGRSDGAGDYVTSCFLHGDLSPCPAGVVCSPHLNPDGTKGGFVANTASAAATAEVGPRARVLGNAQAIGKARILDNALVEGDAKVKGNAQVYENARVSGTAKVEGRHGLVQVFGHARILGNAGVYDWARVYESAEVSGDAQVYMDALVYGRAKVSGHAKVYNRAKVFDMTRVYGRAEIAGGQISNEAKIYGHAKIRDHAKIWQKAEVYDRAEVGGTAKVYNTPKIYGDAIVEGNAGVIQNARVFGHARVYGNAGVFGHARISGNARVFGQAKVGGSAVVKGTARVSGNARVCSGTHTSGTVANQPSCQLPANL